jgi:hypothetical protein
MKIIIELNEENANPFFAVFSQDGDSIKNIEVFTFRVGEPATSLYNKEVNYERALAYANQLERKLKGEVPLKTIVYEKEI